MNITSVEDGRAGGAIGQIFEIMSNLMNFTYKMVESKDLLYGGQVQTFLFLLFCFIVIVYVSSTG